MTAAERKEQSILHKELIDVLTKCKTDDEYLKRLIWGLEIISNEITTFQSDIVLKEYNEEEEEND